MRIKLEEMTQKLVLTADVVHVHNKFVLTGDRSTVTSFRHVMNNPDIARQVSAEVGLPSQFEIILRFGTVCLL